MYLEYLRDHRFRWLTLTKISSLLLFRPIQTVTLTSSLNIHSFSIKTGALADTSTANKQLTSYAKCKAIENARQLFDEMTQRDTVSWNAIITAYVDQKHYEAALELLKSMKINGYQFDQYTFGSALKGVANLKCASMGCQLHAVIVKTGLDSNIFSASALVDMYAKCKKNRDASRVFERMVDRNVVTWNAIITGYAQACDHVSAFWLLKFMEREGLEPNEATFASILTLLDDPKFFNLTSQVHAKIIKYGRASDTIACNAIIAAYSECGSIDDSEKVFYGMEGFRDLVSWNSMLAAYALHNHEVRAIMLFVEMKERGIEQDMYTYTSVISACFEQQKQGKALHGLVTKTGLECAIPVSNSLIVMYLKSNEKSIEDSIKYFSFMNFKDSVSWNSILTGYSQSGFSEEALKFFSQMRSTYMEINHYSLSAVLRSCSDLAVLQLGQQVHNLVIKLGFELNDFVASSLMFMYSKCGFIEDARKTFDETNKKSSITWNSIIFGYAQHGQGKSALDLFSLMQESGVKPDHITFVGIISACSHVGLVEEGLGFLQSMECLYGIQPRKEHYACVIDLLGRAGRLAEAKALIDSMPVEPDAMVWKSLLGACRIHGNMELASYAAKSLVVLDPEEHSTYLILSDLYASSGRWDERATIKRVMRNKGLKKVPGWSWIEVNNEVHAFNAEDHSHPQAKEIYERLGELTVEIGRLGYVAIHDLAYEEWECD